MDRPNAVSEAFQFSDFGQERDAGPLLLPGTFHRTPAFFKSTLKKTLEINLYRIDLKGKEGGEQRQDQKPVERSIETPSHVHSPFKPFDRQGIKPEYTERRNDQARMGPTIVHPHDVVKVKSTRWTGKEWAIFSQANLF